jgi:phosphoribosylformylglycinamidine synthase
MGKRARRRAAARAPRSGRKQKRCHGKPDRIASPLQIMIDGPLGGAAFNNEFGRPNLGGYFRSYEQNVGGPRAWLSQADHDRRRHRQYLGQHTHKNDAGRVALIQMGGPGMRIGMGGSAASSMATGTNTAELDFDSVQRGNPEMERRAQEVINACWQLGDEEPDPVDPRRGRGRSSPTPSRKWYDGAGMGARFDLRQVHAGRERLVAARNLVQRVAGTLCAGHRAGRSAWNVPAAMCERERCPICRGWHGHRRTAA